MVKRLLHHGAGDFVFAEFLAEFGGYFVLDGAHFAFALELGHGEQRFHDAIAAAEFLGLLKDSGRHHEKLIADVTLLFATQFHKLFLSFDLRDTTFLAKLKSLDEVRFADLICRAFVHYHVGFVTHIKQVEIAFGHFVVGGVSDKFAVNARHAHRAQRAGPRDVAHHQRGGCAEDAHHIRLILAIGAEQQAVHLALVEPTLVEERADGAIGEATGENFLVARATFTAEIVAGDLATRRGAFAVIHLQWKPVLAVTAFGGGDDGCHYNRLAHLHGHSAISLFGDVATADRDFFIAKFGGYLMFSHFLSLRLFGCWPRETSVKAPRGDAD